MRALVLIAILSNVLGNFFLSRGMRDVGPVITLSPLPYLHALLDGWVLLGVVLLAAWIIVQLSLLSRADLTYVLPVTATTYMLAALLGEFALGETIPPVHWVGIVLIGIGVALVGLTVPRTTRSVPHVHPPAVVYPLAEPEETPE